MKTIHTKHAPAAIGPYSQAVRVGGFVFLSGQIGIVPEKGTLISSDLKEQAEQVCRNIEAVLKKSGALHGKRNQNNLLFNRYGQFFSFQ